MPLPDQIHCHQRGHASYDMDSKYRTAQSSESTALERQLSSLHNQLKQTLKERQDLDSKDSHSASNTAIMEQLKAMEEEQSFVRQRSVVLTQSHLHPYPPVPSLTLEQLADCVRRYATTGSSSCV